MKQTPFSITLYDAGTEEYQKAAEMLKKVGVRLEAVYPDDPEHPAYLKLTIDPDAYQKAMNRNAGRKQKAVMIGGEFREISVQEVRQMIHENGADQTAAYLGISRRTMYNRLKEAEEIHNDTIF
ncbi:MAG: helix-turn-helix domain-containing protein [Bulleidia sp.]